MRIGRLSSYAVSAILHLALFVAAYITWPLWSKTVDFTQDAVPITIVASAPAPDIRSAEKAEQAQTAAAPDPEPKPQLPAPSPAPQPQPKPAPPPPPAPILKPLPPPTSKTPPLSTPKPQTLNLDQLAAAPKTQAAKPAPKSRPLDLSALAASPKGARSNAPKGAARPETDLLSRLAVGRATALSGDAMSALKAKLGRLWSPNCGVEGAGNVVVKVEMRLTPSGMLAAPPIVTSKTAGRAEQGVVDAAARRALTAVARGEPYTEVPRDADHDIIFRFDAKQMCEGG